MADAQYRSRPQQPFLVELREIQDAGPYLQRLVATVAVRDVRIVEGERGIGWSREMAVPDDVDACHAKPPEA
jgi:hypothetical protein